MHCKKERRRVDQLQNSLSAVFIVRIFCDFIANNWCLWVGKTKVETWYACQTMRNDMISVLLIIIVAQANFTKWLLLMIWLKKNQIVAIDFASEKTILNRFDWIGKEKEESFYLSIHSNYGFVGIAQNIIQLKLFSIEIHTK